MPHDPPPLAPGRAERLARGLLGLEARATPLPGERERNFRLDVADGRRFLLKFVDPSRSPIHVESVWRTLQALADSPIASSLPQPIDRSDGLWLLSWVPGVPLREVRPLPEALFEELGRFLARLDRELERAAEAAPAPHGDRRWNVLCGLEVAEAAASSLPSDLRPLFEDRLGSVRRALAPALESLPRACIHHDANDDNVLLSVPRFGEPVLSGLVDFFDLADAPRCAEVAVAAAYAMFHAADPIVPAAALVRGYVCELPLAEPECDAIADLVRLRLLVSLARSTEARREGAGGWRLRSEDDARRMLEALDDGRTRLLRAALRRAAGHCPWPQRRSFERAAAALRSRGGVRAVIEGGVADWPVVDLSIASPRGLEEDPPERSVGRYDEARLVYEQEAYAEPAVEPRERRTNHLGVDLFAPAGTAVRAPLAGRIHSARDNDRPGDYGPCVILEHEVGGTRFFTLYGHLSRASLERARPGSAVAAGGKVGEIGERTENGGWPPHLHFQVVLDLLGRSGEFPGVAAPRHRDLFCALCPDPALLIDLPEGARAPRPPGDDSLAARRRAVFAPNLSLHYRRPIQVARGRGCVLFDVEGRPLLDLIDNVQHVGHSHPAVVAAECAQARLTNVNTRFLHEGVVRYAERLAGLLPAPLEVVFLVCSGSEANELALRLVRAHTGRNDFVVLDGAYHGNTTTLTALSPYKHRSPADRPPFVHVAPAPDTYRAPDGCGDPGAFFARAVADLVEGLAAAGRPPAAFLAETLPGCAGQLVPPPGFLRAAFEAVREAGGLCVLDEVQVGFGRTGDGWFAFEAEGVVPDVLTLGKPIGNGYPLAAVCTTREVAASFAREPQYFNTFGGNPVAGAVGEAVLDVIERERLVERAGSLGASLLLALREVCAASPFVGDVRGRGLFLGIEFVRDRRTKEPCPEAARSVVERLRLRGVLTQTDGVHDNVVKIKPPLVLRDDQARRFLDELRGVLAESPMR